MAHSVFGNCTPQLLPSEYRCAKLLEGSAVPELNSLTAAVYGTLLSEEILKILLHRVPDMSPATVKGFRRHRIQGRVYPAIIPAEGKSEVQGMVRATTTDTALPFSGNADSSRL